MHSMQVMTKWQETIFACAIITLHLQTGLQIHLALVSLFKSLNTFRDTKSRAKESNYTILTATPCTQPGDRRKDQDVKVTRTPKSEGQGGTLTPAEIFSTEIHQHCPTLGDCDSHICSLQIPRVTISAVQFKHDRNESYSQFCQGFPFVMLSNWQYHRVLNSSSTGLGFMHLHALKRGS